MLQSLPAHQRGIFVLREVMGCSASETAQILELSVLAVNSALQRARAAVSDGVGRPGPLLRERVERYARAIERADLATSSSTPNRGWSPSSRPPPEVSDESGPLRS